MNRPHVDYDQLAPTYHSRYDSGSLPGIRVALLALHASAKPRRVLEVGCGTGHWIGSLRSEGIQVFGADASKGMLRHAAERLGSEGLLVARANHLPFRAGSLDLIFCVNALHHFDDPRAFVRDAFAILAPGGMLAVIGIDPRAIRHRYYYEYFDGTREIDMLRYPSFGEQVDTMTGAGFNDVELRIIDTPEMVFEGRTILSDPFLAKESNSLLALLTADQYARGVQRIEAAVAQAEREGNPIVFRSKLPFGMVTGRRTTR